MDKWLAGLVIVSFVLLPLVFAGNLNVSEEHKTGEETGEASAAAEQANLSVNTGAEATNLTAAAASSTNKTE